MVAGAAAVVRHPAIGHRRRFRHPQGRNRGGAQSRRTRPARKPWRTLSAVYRTDGTLLSQTARNRDGSRIHSEFGQGSKGVLERNAVTLPDGKKLTFETDPTGQSVYDRRGRLVQQVLFDPTKGQYKIELYRPSDLEPDPRRGRLEDDGMGLVLLGAALVLYSHWLGTRQANEEIVLAFKAEEFEVGADSPVWVSKRTREEVIKMCGEKFNELQDLANSIAASTSRRDFPDPADFGKKVHTKMKNEIHGPDETPKDPNLRAEISLQEKEDGSGTEEARYGAKDTTRLDIYHDLGNGTVCVYDVKTGKSGLGKKQISKIAKRVNRFRKPKRFVVVEIRTGR